MLGQEQNSDVFGTIEVPKFFIDQSWYVEKKITLLKYFDLSEELNKFEDVSMQLHHLNTTKTNGTFDNSFDFITVPSKSLDDVLSDVNTHIIDPKSTDGKFQRETITYQHQNLA